MVPTPVLVMGSSMLPQRYVGGKGGKRLAPSFVPSCRRADPVSLVQGICMHVFLMLEGECVRFPL